MSREQKHSDPSSSTPADRSSEYSGRPDYWQEDRGGRGLSRGRGGPSRGAMRGGLSQWGGRDNPAADQTGYDEYSRGPGGGDQLSDRKRDPWAQQSKEVPSTDSWGDGGERDQRSERGYGAGHTQGGVGGRGRGADIGRGRGSYADGRGGYTEGRGGYTEGRGGYTEGRGGYTDGRGGYTEGRGGYTEGRGGHTDGRGGHTDGRGGYTEGASRGGYDLWNRGEDKPGKTLLMNFYYPYLLMIFHVNDIRHMLL